MEQGTMCTCRQNSPIVSHSGKKYIFMQLNAIFIPLKGQASFFTSSSCLLVKYVQVIFISYYYYFDLSEERGDGVNSLNGQHDRQQY